MKITELSFYYFIFSKEKILKEIHPFLGTVAVFVDC